MDRIDGKNKNCRKDYIHENMSIRKGIKKWSYQEIEKKTDKKILEHVSRNKYKFHSDLLGNGLHNMKSSPGGLLIINAQLENIHLLQCHEILNT